VDERDRDLLTAIAESARLAIGYAKAQGAHWLEDLKTTDAIAKRVEEVGELAKRVDPETLTVIPADWRGAKAFREVLAHGYGRLDTVILGDIIDTNLPLLLAAVEEALRDQ
jgi:uncharacterized protein with HEPN domain